MLGNWASVDVKDIYKQVGTSEVGLSQDQVALRLKKFGLNELVKKSGISPLKIFLNQFKSLLVWLLIVAIGISVFVAAMIDAYVIGAIVVINAVLGFVQEYKAERAIEALKKLSAPEATVIRNGQHMKIPAKELVPGDILVLSEGDKIAADARLIQVVALQVNEAALTGESNPVIKEIKAIQGDLVIADAKNMVFMNTTVLSGRGLAVVVDTGMQTEVGNIAKMISGISNPPTPLQKRLDSVGRTIGVAVVIIAAVVFALGVFRSHLPVVDMLITSIALAVAAVPEGLPAIVTITLAIGLNRLAKAKSLVRRLPVVETLGSATVICADKTGTITEGEMTITDIYSGDKLFKISGSGYDPDGEFTLNKRKIDIKKEKNLNLLLTAGTLCTTAELKQNNDWEVIGDTTEGAIIVAAHKAGLIKQELKEQYTWLGESPFDAKRKLMSVAYKASGKRKIVFVKGAPEVLLGKCSHIQSTLVKRIKKEDKEKILGQNESMAKEALRVLGIAYKYIPDKSSKYTQETMEDNLIFLGLVGMIDPPREEAREAVALCQQAGIRVIMITGDNPLTAQAISEDIGIYKEGDRVMLGEDLEHLSDLQFNHAIKNISIFARVSPEHKLKIVTALQKQNEVVAMTGDGVNDAPALKKADIGISMGIIGTDVAKEASDMVLQDDNFSTIVSAIREGRGIYENVHNFIRYLISSNVGEVLTIFVAALIGFPLPLIAVQILWMNLLTDGMPALALGLDPPEKDIMQRRPRDPSKAIIDKNMWVFILIVGLVTGVGTLAVFWRALPVGLEYARTMAFSTIVMFQMANVFNSRSEKSVFKEKRINKWLILAVASSIALQLLVVYVPFFQNLFGTIGLGAMDWLWIAGISLTTIVAIEIKKAVAHKSL